MNTPLSPQTHFQASPCFAAYMHFKDCDDRSRKGVGLSSQFTNHRGALIGPRRT